MPEVPESRIRVFGSPVDLYQLDNGDFERIRRAGQSISKDIFLCSLPLSITLLINAFGELGKPPGTPIALSSITSAGFGSFLFLNSVLGFIGAVVALISGIVWYVTYENLSRTIDDIKAEKKQIN